jgi:peptidylprolyl isomerase
VGTPKRERQKANRQIRLQELAKEQRKEKSKKVVMRVVIAVIAVVALVGGVYLFSGNDKNTTSTASSTSGLLGATTTTVAPKCLAPATTTTNATATTSTVPAKPTVKQPGADVTELKTTVLKEGTGEGAKNCDVISVHYIGVLSKDGTAFDNSYDHGEPFTITLGAGSVIPGWEQGLLGAKKGSQIQLDIPAALAYGDTGQGSIPAGASITFVIDVMDIQEGTANPAAATTTVSPTVSPTTAPAGTDTTAAATPTT